MRYCADILLRTHDCFESAVLSDFDTAIANTAPGKSAVVGTAGYVAPELLQLKEYSYNVDIWSLGVVLYVMLVGKNPFPQSESKQAVEATCDGLAMAHKLTLEGTPAAAVDIIHQMLDVDAVHRASARQVCQSSFVTGVAPAGSIEPAGAAGAEPVRLWPGDL